MKFFKLPFFLILSVFLFWGCKSKVSTPKELSQKYGVEQFEFDFLSLKSKLSFKNQKQELSSKVDIRMAKDSLIWLSARPAFGIEAARMLIRTDSAFLVNRLEKSYSAVSIQELTEQVNFDGGFKTLQSLFLGNIPPLMQTITPKKQDEFFVLNQEYDLFNTALYISRGNKKLSKFTVTQDEGMNSFFVDYEDFNKVENQVVPFEIKALANFFNQKTNQTDQTVISVSHKSMELQKEALSFPFSIPSSYEQKALTKKK